MDQLNIVSVSQYEDSSTIAKIKYKRPTSQLQIMKYFLKFGPIKNIDRTSQFDDEEQELLMEFTDQQDFYQAFKAWLMQPRTIPTNTWTSTYNVKENDRGFRVHFMIPDHCKDEEVMMDFSKFGTIDYLYITPLKTNPWHRMGSIKYVSKLSAEKAVQETKEKYGSKINDRERIIPVEWRNKNLEILHENCWSIVSKRDLENHRNICFFQRGWEIKLHRFCGKMVPNILWNQHKQTCNYYQWLDKTTDAVLTTKKTESLCFITLLEDELKTPKRTN